MGRIDDDDVVISGQSFRLPGVKNLNELSKKLNASVPIVPTATAKERNMFTGYDDIPGPDRVMDKLDYTDLTFCGMSRSVADHCDFTMRKLLLLCYEALMDAGIHPQDVEDINCALFQTTAQSDGEVLRLWPTDIASSCYFVTGSSRAMEANRISFFLNSKGSSISIDNGYSGGLMAMEIAHRDIKTGRADMAIVCGSNLAIHLENSIQCHHLGFMSKNGETRAFDDDATGYQRSMGISAFILQPAKSAKRIYAKIRHIEVYQEREPLTQTIDKWEKIMYNFYKRSKIPLEEISYLEPYCCGIKEMDAAELNAVSNRMCKDRKTPLLIGSIKSNLGHTEGCADHASILKALSMFETGIIPANENYKTPNSNVPALVNGQLRVVDHPQPLPDGLIAINSFSFGGSYAHMVLERFTKVKHIDPVVSIPRLIPLSARVENFIPNNIQLLKTLPYDPELYHLVTDLFRRPIRKNLGKGFVILEKDEEAISRFTTLDEVAKRPVWFMFSGMGSQWLGMGTQLMKIPLIRESLERSHRALEPKGMDLIHVLTTADSTIFDNILYAFVGISAIQIALVDLMRALKVKPDGVIGHSLGEQSCAYASGCLTAEQTILAAYCRGRASLAVPLIKGMMAAVGMGYNQIKDELPEGVEVACHNSSSSCTLSGPAEIIAKYVDQLTERKVFARAVNVGNIAYHSTHIKPAANYLRTSLTEVVPEAKPRPVNWISTSIPEDQWDSELAQTCSAEYLTNNLTSSVLFEEGCKHVPENAIVIEFAPHGLLQAIVKRSMKSAVHVSLTNKQAKDSATFLLEALGSLYMAGLEMDINVLYPGVEYPVSRGTLSLQPFIHWVDEACFPLGVPFGPNRDINIRQALAAIEPSMIGIKLADRNVFHISTYFYLLEEQLRRFYKDRRGKELLKFVDSTFGDIINLSVITEEWLEEFHSRALNSSELVTRDGKLVAKGYSYVLETAEISSPFVSNDDKIVTIPKEELYKWFTKQGYVIPPALQALNYIAITNKGLISSIPSKSSRAAKIEALLQVVTFDNISKGKSIIFPRGIRELTIDNSINCYKKDEDLDVLYDRALGSVTCRGLCMSGVQFETVIPQETPLSFHSLRTVPFKNPTVESTSNFIKFCCDLVESGQNSPEKLKIVNFIDESATVALHIEANNAPIEVTKGKTTGDEAVNVAEYDLVVCTKQQLPKFINTANNYIIVKGSGPLIVPNYLVTVSMFTAEKDQLWLLKKKIILNGERDFIEIPDKKEDLIAKLRARGKKSVLVVGFKEPSEGLTRYQKIIQSQVKANIKWLLVLDKEAPQFNVDTPLYRQQLEKGLPVNILLNGEWHFNMKIRICGPKNKKGGTNITNTQGEDWKSVVEQLENKRKMGIRKENSNNEFDDVLSWPVPQSWNEDDISSIPVSYSLAYYCLKVIFDVKYENILVTDGLSELGQAAIAVSLGSAGRVFVSVASKEEATQLMELFPQVKADDIIYHNDTHFAFRLRHAIGDSHPQVIYNTLEGDQFKCCLENINQFGKMFHFGSDDIKRNTIVGMATFLKLVSLYCLNTNSPRNWTQEDKKQVQAFVSEGIRTGVVKLRTWARHVRSAGVESQYLSSKRQSGSFITLNGTYTYVVVGEASDLDVDVAEWLARNGAKNITICTPSTIIKPDYQRKMKTLQLHRNVNIQTVEQLALKKHIKDTNVHAVFFINIDAVLTKNQLELFEDFLRSEFKNLVTISRGRDYVLKMAKMDVKALTCTNIIWETSEDQLLGQSLDAVVPYLSHHSTIAVSQDIPNKYSCNIMKDILPETLEKYQNQGLSLKTKPALVPLVTLGSARRCDLKYVEVTPLIVLPGLQDDPVKFASQLVKEAMIHAYVATSPAIGLVSLASTANSIVQLIKSTLPRKTYNLVGVSTGCALALEVTRQLEIQGSIVFLLLLDNKTFPLQKTLRTEDDLQTACLDSLSSFVTNEIDDEKMKCLSWSARLSHVVSCLDRPLSVIPKAATYIYDTINALLSTDYADFKIKGPLTVMRFNDSNDESKYNFMTSNNIVVDLPVPSSTLLSNVDVKKMLNVFIGYEGVSPAIANQVAWTDFEYILSEEKRLPK